MKKLIIIVIFLIFVKSLIAQTIKTYSGSYEVGGSNFFNNNTATYQYYDDANYKRVYHGKFDFNHGQVTGYFANNKRTGHWKWVKKQPSYTSYRVPFPGYTITVSGNYKNGKKIGAWNYERRGLVTHKLTMSSTATFRNDTLVGKYSYIDYTKVHPSNDERDIKVSGQFNNNGAIDGEWIITYYRYKVPFQEVRKYRNGVLYWNISRNISTGEILEQIDKTDFINQFTQKEGSESSTVLIDKIEYKLVPAEYQTGMRLNFNHVVTFWHNFEKETSDNEMYRYKFPDETYTDVAIFKQIVKVGSNGYSNY